MSASRASRPATPARAALETARLRLRPFTGADLAAHARLYSDPDVTRHLACGALSGPAAAEHSRRTVQRFVEHWNRLGFGVWAVFDRATGTFIGQCGLNVVPESSGIEVLYALDRGRWGRGLATEAAEAALGYGFERAGLDRIIAITRPEHAASRRVMEKLGMTYERAARYHGLEVVCYAISRAAFLARVARV